MIRIDQVTDVDPTAFSRYAKFEWDRAGELGQLVVKQSVQIWRLSKDGAPVVFAGVVRPSLLDLPVLWFFLCKDFHPRQVRELREAMRELLELYPRVRAWVNVEFRAGCRFAERLGWKPLDTYADAAGIKHRLYEARR